eukprot:scaffold517_cov119-Cylindrotheca_fusiformis.AAC.37
MLPRMQRMGGPYGMYGTVYGVSTAVVHIAHPLPAKAVFGNSVRFSNGSPTKQKVDTTTRRSSRVETTGSSKAPAYDHFKNFCGEGVFTANGEDWKAKRASVMHCLVKGVSNSNSDIFQRLEGEANRAADTFIAQIKQLQRKQTKDITANVVPLLQRATVGLIYRYITHDDPDWEVTNCSLPNTSKESTKFAETKIEPIKGRLDSYLDSIIRIRMIILAQSRSIWFLLPRWCYRFFSSLYRDEERTVSPIRMFAKDACLRAKPGSPLAKLKERASHGGTSSPDAIPQDMLDETITLLFAGQDTSAATLSWTLHLLSLYPSVQTKLANEISSVLEKAGMTAGDSRIGKELFQKMPYLDAVIKESMRLYPVAPFVVRKLIGDIPVFDDGKVAKPDPIAVLPAGSLACIWIYGLHRNPLFWDKPEEFVPERWMNSGAKDIGQTNGAYMPFASGPRNCVGQPLAHTVLRTVLSRIVGKYEFQDERLKKGHNPNSLRKDMQAGFTVLPSGGVHLIFKERHF